MQYLRSNESVRLIVSLSQTVIRVPLIHEEVKIKGEHYVRQDIVIRKKPRIETKTVNDFVISEKVDTKVIIWKQENSLKI
jgi:stress response protein YsnF